MQLCAELCQEVDGQIIPYVEVGVGEVEKHIRTRVDLSDITTVGFRDDVLNLSRLGFGTANDLKAAFDTEMTALASALRQDAEGGLICRASIPMTWEDRGILVTLTIAGDAKMVATVVQQLPTVIDPTQPPSEWIEPLSDLIQATTPRARSPVMWDGVYRGVVAIGRTGVVEQRMLMPAALMQQLLSSGKLKISKAEDTNV